MFNSGDIVTLKLTSAEEVVGQLVEENASTLIISKPMSVVSGKTVSLTPYAVSAEADVEITILRSSLICYFKTSSQIADQYNSQTSA